MGKSIEDLVSRIDEFEADSFLRGLLGENAEELVKKVYPPFHSWIPDDVKEIYAILNSRQRTHEEEIKFELLERLVRSKQMKNVWELINRRRKAPNDELLMLANIYYALNGYSDFDFKVNSEQLEILEDIKDKAIRLSRLIAKTPLKSGYTVAARSVRDNVFSAEQLQSSRFSVLPNIDGSLIEFLNGLAEHAELVKSKDPVIQRIKVKDAREIYFIRRLVTYFRERYREPLWDSITIITNCMLDTNYDKDLIRNKAGRKFHN